MKTKRVKSEAKLVSTWHRYGDGRHIKISRNSRIQNELVCLSPIMKKPPTEKTASTQNNKKLDQKKTLLLQIDYHYEQEHKHLISMLLQTSI